MVPTSSIARPMPQLESRLIALALALISGCCEKNRSPLPPSEVVTAACQPTDVTTDGTHLYLACWNKIERVSLSNGKVEEVAKDPDHPQRIALHGGQVYWTTKAATNHLRTALQGGGPVETLSPAKIPPDSPLLADDDGVYLVSSVSERGDGVVHFAPVGETTRFVAKTRDVAATALSNDELFWSTKYGKELYAVRKAGGRPRVVATVGSPISSIWLEKDWVYFCASPRAKADGTFDGGLLRVRTAGGAVEQRNALCNGEALLVVGTWVCWSSNASYTSKLASARTGELHCVPNRKLEREGRHTRVFEGTSASKPIAQGNRLYWVGTLKEPPTTNLYRVAVPATK